MDEADKKYETKLESKEERGQSQRRRRKRKGNRGGLSHAVERGGNKGPQRFLAKEFHDDNDNNSLKEDDNNSLEDKNDDDDDDGSEDGNNIGNVERFETSKRAKCFLSTRVTRI